MRILNDELLLRQQAVEDKKQKDTTNYGKPLGNKQLTDKVEIKQRQIEELKHSDGRWKLPKYDQKILNAIRKNHVKHSTSSEGTYKYDNRFNGSANSRKQARNIHRRY